MDQAATQFGEVIGTAREYCALIDHAKPADAAWLDGMFRLLPRLHAAITATKPTRGNALLPVQIDVDERFDLYSRLRAGLGERDGYWMEFDNDNAINSLHMSGSLADDLTDIYFDLKSGLEMLSQVRPERVLRFWHRSYELHWGQHLVDAERHLYALMTQQGFT
jgi:hypothetical protein